MNPTAELGRLEGPVLLFGGPYGNLEATNALFDAADRLSIPAGNIVCTGDVVAYCADPAATVDLVRRRGIAVVQGNCEESLGQGAEDCGCGFGEGTVCDRLSAAWYDYCAAALDGDAKRWMAGLPGAVAFELAGRRFVAVHGSVSQINRFVFFSTPAEFKAGELRRADADAVIAGHSGLPFVQTIGTRLWLNAGVIGMPANDGTPRGWYALLLPTAGGGVEVEIRGLDYDHAAAAAKMRRAGLPDEYRVAIETGLWDNMEILPEPERALRAAPLAERRLAWTGAALQAAE